MKHLKLLPALILIAFQVHSQSSDPSMVTIHEDKVLTDRTAKYWEASSNLKKALEANKIQGVKYWAFQGDDGSISYVAPMDNFAELDKDMWKEVSDKIGADKFSQLMDGFNGCYLSHIDYSLKYHPDKSYNTESWTEKDVYRQLQYFYLYDDKMDTYYKLLDEWKAALSGINSTMGYQVYSNGYGMGGPVVIIMTWGENVTDQEQEYLKAYNAMKDKWDELWKKTQPCVYKMETRRVWSVPELTYFPTN